MVGRLLLSRAEPGFTLPAYERLAPPPPPELLQARLEANSAPGDIVADLHGRGGWIARAAIDRQRRGFSLETGPLTRLLAEVVLRPPDLRHLDAAFSALGTSPHGETSLRLAINDLFATKCVSCGRTLPIDELRVAGRPAGEAPLPLPAVPRPAEPARAPGGRAERLRTSSGPRATSARLRSDSDSASGSRSRTAATP